MDLGLELVLGDSRNKNNEDESNLNISDVIEVIQTTDPGMFSGGGEINGTPGSSGSGGQRGSSTGSNGANRRGAFVKILEQPASKALRFRYECEGRSAGSIPGASSTPENKTFPAIQVVGYKGRAVVVVSCVTKDPPYRPHPHNLVGREGCRRGVCTLEVSPETMAVTFSNLGIQCVKKKDIEEALRVREEIRVDPFRTGFAHRNQPTSIDLNAVRLCFQVFLEGDSRGKFTVPLNPIVSDPIYDKKAMSDLVICKLSDCSCTVAGGKEIILLCEKVAKEDIQVRFYEESNGNIVWESLGDFQPTHVHKQVAISFRTPRYRSLEVPEPVKVFIQLRRPSDGATSESLPFEFLPLDSDPVNLKRKRQKFGNDPNNVLRHFQEQEQARNIHSQINMLNIPPEASVKVEPRDTSPSPYGGQMYGSGLSPMYIPQGGASPQQQYMFPVDPGRTPSPMDAQNYNNYSPQAQNFPNIQVQFANSPNAQNIPSTVATSPIQIQMSHMSAGLSNYMVAQAQQQQQHNQHQQQQHQHQHQHQQPSWASPMNIVDGVEATGSVTVAVPVTFDTAAEASNAISTSGVMDAVQTGLSSVLDLDSKELTQLNSAELDGLNLFDANLSENLSNNLTLADPYRHDDTGQENATDSFTRLTNATIADICKLENAYKPNIKE